MPNRIIKESICTSDTIDQLTWFEEVFFYRLIVNCDDYGRCDARPAILKAKLFPIKSVTDKQVKETLNKLSTVGIAMVYERDHKPFLQLKTWNDHQRIRAKVSKYPSPDAEAVTCDDMVRSRDSNVTTCGDQIQYNSNPIQGESNPEAVQTCLTPEMHPKTVISLQLKDKEKFDVTEEELEGWRRLYPDVDVMQSLRNMKGWLEANPKRRKTLRGITRFVNAWLLKDQERAGISNEGARQVRGGDEGAGVERYGTVL